MVRKKERSLEIYIKAAPWEISYWWHNQNCYGLPVNYINSRIHSLYQSYSSDESNTCNRKLQPHHSHCKLVLVETTHSYTGMQRSREYFFASIWSLTYQCISHTWERKSGLFIIDNCIEWIKAKLRKRCDCDLLNFLEKTRLLTIASLCKLWQEWCWEKKII